MNSDPYDSAAWRTFGMLDADESAIFDEAMRHDPLLRSAYLEMDRLSAAIAATSVAPIPPRAAQWERLQSRLGLNSTHRGHLWLGISGWAAAAVLTVLLILDRRQEGDVLTTQNTTGSANPTAATAPTTTAAAGSELQAVPPPQETQSTKETAATGADAEILATHEPDPKSSAKVETKRLIQEIEVLRDNLEKFQRRDRILFEAVPGMALPVIMTMNPPGMVPDVSPSLSKNDDHSPITAMLGDAVRVMTSVASGEDAAALQVAGTANPGDSASEPLATAQPTAIPIYDAARDAGTLVVSNLPPTQPGKVYNLWVTTASGERPIYVGSLPESSAAGADSFDFSLGSTMVLPSGFLLTEDPADKPANPTDSNTVLQGPPTPAR